MEEIISDETVVDFNSHKAKMDTIKSIMESKMSSKDKKELIEGIKRHNLPDLPGVPGRLRGLVSQILEEGE